VSAGAAVRFPHLLAANITVGDHVQTKVAGLTLNLDTIWATGVAMVIVIGMGLLVRSRATAGVPGKLQLVWEMAVGAVRTQIEGSVGPRGAAVVPLALTLFIFILVADWFSVLGTGAHFEWLGPPTGDINLPLAMAIVVIIPVHIASLRVRGLRGYIRHYFQPYKVLVPVNVIEEIAKPITLSLRLFGNLLSGGLMLALIAALGVWSLGHVPIGNIADLLLNPVWKLFDLLIGAIQAFIFALLAILYFDTAMSDAH
jgi:F-type H+-transporting ATPase subunit a